MEFRHSGRVYFWSGRRWSCEGRPLSLNVQNALSRAYILALDPSWLPDVAVARCAVVCELARIDPSLVECALDFTRQILRAHPRHQGALALRRRLSA